MDLDDGQPSVARVAPHCTCDPIASTIPVRFLSDFNGKSIPFSRDRASAFRVSPRQLNRPGLSVEFPSKTTCRFQARPFLTNNPPRPPRTARRSATGCTRRAVAVQLGTGHVGTASRHNRTARVPCTSMWTSRTATIRRMSRPVRDCRYNPCQRRCSNAHRPPLADQGGICLETLTGLVEATCARRSTRRRRPRRM